MTSRPAGPYPMPSAEPRLEHFLGFEDSSEVLEFRFEHDDLLMWPFIRYTTMAHALEGSTGFQIISVLPAELTALEALRYVSTSLRLNPLRITRHFDIVMIGSTGGLVIKEGPKWLGRINDFFARAFEDRTLVMDDSMQRRYRLPRAVRNHACHDWLRLRSALLGRVSGRVPAGDRRAIEGLIDLLRRRFPARLNQELLKVLSLRLEKISARLPFLHGSYHAFFERVGPRMIFLEGGSYGEESYIFKWAKDAGIQTAEFQHGALHDHHAAYNYGGAILRSTAYHRYLPDFLLTYGRFWNSRVRMPSEIVAIGNPYVSERAFAERSRESAGARRVLIISDTSLPAFFEELALELANRLPSTWEIVLKPHPWEGDFIRERFGRLIGVERITLAGAQDDLYDWFARCECVVGMCSTSLFEALAFRKKLFVRDHFVSDWGVPATLAPRFRDAAELVDMIRASGGSPEEGPSLEDIWQPDWRQHYAAFIDAHVDQHD